MFAHHLVCGSVLNVVYIVHQLTALGQLLKAFSHYFVLPSLLQYTSTGRLADPFIHSSLSLIHSLSLCWLSELSCLARTIPQYIPLTRKTITKVSKPLPLLNPLRYATKYWSSLTCLPSDCLIFYTCHCHLVFLCLSRSSNGIVCPEMVLINALTIFGHLSFFSYPIPKKLN